VIQDERLNLVAISETWVSDLSPCAVITNITNICFAVHNVHRVSSKRAKCGRVGGGIALVYRSGLQVKLLPTNHYCHTTFELLLSSVTVDLTV